MNDQWALGVQEWYSPSVVNTGASGWYSAGNLTLRLRPRGSRNGLGAYVSGDVGYWKLGTSDTFYGTVLHGAFPGGVPYKSYWNWDAGLGFTWKAFTLDLRYYDSNLTKAECNVFTSDSNGYVQCDHVTALKSGGLGSNWCSATFIAKLSFATNISSIK